MKCIQKYQNKSFLTTTIDKRIMKIRATVQLLVGKKNKRNEIHIIQYLSLVKFG